MSIEVPNDVLDFIASQKTLTIATVGPDGKPHAATLLYVNEGATLFIWTHSGTTTAQHIGEGGTVGFAVDAYSDDQRQTKGLQGSGDASAATGEDLARAADLFGQKYPNLRPGASAAVSFLRIEPSELHYIDNTQGGDIESDEFRRQSFGG